MAIGWGNEKGKVRETGSLGSMMKAYFESYGCSLSSGESEMMKQMALEKGWELAQEVDEADLLVLSTCIVVQATEAKMSHRIKALAKVRKPFVVYGCMASAMAQKVRHLAPGAWLLRPEELAGFGEMIERAGRPLEIDNGQVHANIPIANGCKGDCTFCITKVARGPLRSRAMADIVKQVEKELAIGRKEIRLTAQDIALYGQDIGNESGLRDLVERIGSLEGRFKVRIGMMNPNSLSKVLGSMVHTFKHPKVYGFLHLPAQSGSDKILELMERGYTVNDFVEVLKVFKREIPDLFLSTDIIAGFPGENQEDFEASLNLLSKIGPGIINIKAFSARAGTKAKSLPGRVDTKVVKERTRALTKLRDQISLAGLKEFKGREYDVLLTESVKPGTTMGRTPEYRPIAVRGVHPLGTFLRVLVTDARRSYLLGEPI